MGATRFIFALKSFHAISWIRWFISDYDFAREFQMYSVFLLLEQKLNKHNILPSAHHKRLFSTPKMFYAQVVTDFDGFSVTLHLN